MGVCHPGTLLPEPDRVFDRLIEIRGTTLVIEDVDILDDIPLLDLKPYVPAFDSYLDAAAGWREHVANGAESVRSEKRFK